MSKKRRVFDIEMPDDSTPTFPAGKVDVPDRPARKGPMASAIGETGEAARERREVEARIRDENDRLAHEHVRLKRMGLLVDLIPLDAVSTYKLTRDRTKGPDPELAELKQSIRDLGLSNPIRVEATGDGTFELIQGWRRWSAFRELHAETGDETFAAIPATVTQKGETLEALYRRMVDENLVRKDISFAEMAQLALDYAADPGTSETDPDKAVALLFKSTGYQKRSYIRTFIRVVEALSGSLMFAPEIPRSLGLALAQRLDEVEGLAGAIRRELAEYDNRSVRDELEVLRRYAGIGPGQGDDGAPRAAAPAPRSQPGKARAKTSFQFDQRGVPVKCTAVAGRLEVRLDRDFSTLDRRKLEAAVRFMLQQLD